MVESKVCGKCKKRKPAADFNKKSASPDGLQNYCKQCNCGYVKDWLEAKPEKKAAKNAGSTKRSKERYATDEEYRDRKRATTKKWMDSLTAEARKAFHRKTWLWGAYRLRPEAFEQAKVEQNGLCACCGQIPLEWIIDHCHDTGLVRGLVCRRCNNGLGSFDDDIKGLEKAIAYLQAFNDRDKEP
jgi:hypothetical protein